MQHTQLVICSLPGSIRVHALHMHSLEPDLACQAAVASSLCMNGVLRGVSGLWIGDCFIYTNGAWRLNYCVGGEVTTMFHLDRPMYLLGYLAAQSKVYLIDKVSDILSTASPCSNVYLDM